MSTTRRRRGKEVAEEPVDVGGVLAELPPRLFATDRFPSERVNMYCKINYLLWVRDTLGGTPAMKKLLDSCFGKLFDLPVRRLHMGKVIHSMMTRQVVTKKKYEMWPVFGGKPLRFSLVEFGEVTGLSCDEFEYGYSVEYEPEETEENYEYWEKLIGEDRNATIDDVIAMVDGDEQMSWPRKMRLCLIVIVDGVLVCKSQKARPSLKYVNMVKSIREFLAFPWGRESFLWTISDLKPPLKRMGVCENPESDFCAKLRQQTVKASGFPLALQLLAFEAIPQLLNQVAGDDSVTLLNYPEKALPQHVGLTVVHVRKAEHNQQLMVQPMMEISGDREARWGLWDDENYDRKVEYMMGLLQSGHSFVKGNWSGGDAGTPLYVFGKTERMKKRKADKPIGDEPVLKQRRMSAYFKRGAVVDPQRIDQLEARVAELFTELELLKSVCHGQAKEIKKWRDLRKGKGVRRQRSAVSRKMKKRRSVGGSPADDEDGAGASGEVGRVNEMDLSGCERSPLKEKSVSKDFGEDENKTPEKCSDDREGSDMAGGGSASEEVLSLLMRMKEGDGVPLQWVEGPEGSSENEGASFDGGVSVRQTGEDGISPKEKQTLDVLVTGLVKSDVASVPEEGLLQPLPLEVDSSLVPVDIGKVAEKTSFVEAGKAIAAEACAVAGGDSGLETACSEGLLERRSPGAVMKQRTGAFDASGSGTQDEQKVNTTSPLVDEGLKVKDDGHVAITEMKTGVPVTALFEDLGDLSKPKQVKEADPDMNELCFDAERPETTTGESVTVISDSPVKLPDRHKPVQEEEQLAALLLSKPPPQLGEIVPMSEDPDFPFFEKVLQSNPGAMHLNAGGRDLDNNFFIELATPCKWVSSTHMEVLMEYSERRYGLILQLHRSMFVAPWFTAHMQGKYRAFKAAQEKTRVAGDSRITKYLTKKGHRWGVEIDTLYAPMIWGSDHWVGLCISLTDWRILVLDPNPGLKTTEEMVRLLEPVATMLPYIIKKIAPANDEGEHQLVPFRVERLGGVYVNRRSGDCGPVAVKFMELHGTGDLIPTMAGLSDELVDIFRKQYAMDIYKDVVVPVYLK